MGGSGFQKEKSMCEGPKARKILYAQRSYRGEAYMQDKGEMVPDDTGEVKWVQKIWVQSEWNGNY